MNNSLDSPPEAGMVFTVEPGIYIAREKESVELHREPYDSQAALDLAYLEGAAEAKRITGERKDGAESFTYTVPVEYLGIGVRIEDDVIVTDRDCRVLTSVTKNIDDLVL